MAKSKWLAKFNIYSIMGTFLEADLVICMGIGSLSGIGWVVQTSAS